MNTYQDLTPHERMVIVAKIYHNIWYDKRRYEQLQHLLLDWEESPIKEAKYLNQINNGAEQQEFREGNISF